jgi:hypothetical protein
MKVLQPLTQDKALIAKAAETATGFLGRHAADALTVPAIVSRPDTGLLWRKFRHRQRIEQSGQAAFEPRPPPLRKTINSLLES